MKRFDELIVKAPASVQLAFLRGLWLGDGHVGSTIELYNTDLRIIKAVSTLLKMHGVEHTVRGPYPQPKSAPHGVPKKPRYVVYIRRCSREKFLELTGLAESPPRPVQ